MYELSRVELVIISTFFLFLPPRRWRDGCQRGIFVVPLIVPLPVGLVVTQHLSVVGARGRCRPFHAGQAHWGLKDATYSRRHRGRPVQVQLTRLAFWDT